MEIAIKVDCGNSPKKILVKELTILFASYQIDQAKPFFSDNIKWTLIGETSIIGKEKLAGKMIRMNSLKTKKLTIHNIITHG